jgi:hypothetical protein
MLYVSADDANGRSDVMLDAVSIWQSTIQDVFWHLPTRPNWRFQLAVSKGSICREGYQAVAAG